MNKTQAEQDRALASGLMDLGPRAILNTGPQSILNSNTQVHTQNPVYNSALHGATIAATGTYTVKRHPWVSIEVDCVGNGFILRTNDVTLIAKDLEELQQHFTAQVADTLLKWSK